MYAPLVLALVYATTCFADVSFNDCSGKNNIRSVAVSGCSGTNCNLKLGSTVHITATFEAVVGGTQAFSAVKGLIKGREMNFPQPKEDGCATRKINPPCPMVAGKKYTYTDDFEIKSFIPPGPVLVTYSGTNEKGQTIACASMNAVVKK